MRHDAHLSWTRASGSKGFIMKTSVRLACAAFAAACSVAWNISGESRSEQTTGTVAALPETAALDWPEEDLSGRMMDGAHRFVERQIAATLDRSARFWKYDPSSAATWNASIQDNRDRLKEIIGATDARLPPRVERFGDDGAPALVAETKRYRVHQVRWPVVEDVWAEGLLVEPTSNTPSAHIVVLPDAGQSPEQVLGLAPGLPPDRQFARSLAESG